MPAVIVDKYQEIDGAKNGFLGHRFVKGERLAGDMKCPLCGKWFSWVLSKIETYIIERRWDYRKEEPVHCGNSMCHDYHMRYLKHCERLKKDIQYQEDHFVRNQVRQHGVDENSMWKLFQRLRRKGLVT